MLVLGLDHAVSGTAGYGVLEYKTDGSMKYIEHGTFQSPEIGYPRNMAYLYEKFVSIIHKILPRIVVFEDQKSNRNFTITQKLQEVKGAMKVYCVLNKIPFTEIPPSTMKLIVTGYGHASKRDVAESVATKLGVDFDLITSAKYYRQGLKKGQIKSVIYDGSDALGLCVAWFSFMKIKGGGIQYDGK